MTTLLDKMTSKLYFCIKILYIMKTLRLLPTYWKRIGFFAFAAGMTLGVLSVFGNFEIPGFELHLRKEGNLFQSTMENFTNELALTLLVAGLLLVAYSREKLEDERIQLIRLEAFQWSILANFVIILIANWFCYGSKFWIVMLSNLFTPLAVFLLRFYYILYFGDKEQGDEIPEAV